MGAILRARLTHQKPHIKNKTQNKIPNPNTLLRNYLIPIALQIGLSSQPLFPPC